MKCGVVTRKKKKERRKETKRKIDLCRHWQIEHRSLKKIPGFNATQFRYCVIAMHTVLSAKYQTASQCTSLTGV